MDSTWVSGQHVGGPVNGRAKGHLAISCALNLYHCLVSYQEILKSDVMQLEFLYRYEPWAKVGGLCPLSSLVRAVCCSVKVCYFEMLLSIPKIKFQPPKQQLGY